MDTIKCIKTRRSIRKYLDKPVPDKLINELIDCARHAPSAHNCQSWEFVIVKDSAAKKRLADALVAIRPHSNFINGAPVVIVCCYDQTKVASTPTDVFSPALAAENLLLAAHDHGLGACWVYIKDSEDLASEKLVKKTLSIPKDFGVICLIPVGYPDEVPGARELRPIEGMRHEDKW